MIERAPRRLLFVTNGHGEASIAVEIARHLASATCEHLGLVGEALGTPPLRDVGPQRRMPSGGLIAMGNLRNIVRDLRGGLVALTLAQLAFVRAARGAYDAVVAVGDVYALALALVTRAPVVFVGTAKSVYVAPYGRGERALLRRAVRVFVRDAATAEALRARRVAASAPGNVISDLASVGEARSANGTVLAVLPGSRESAYADAARWLAVVRALAVATPIGAVRLSLAPSLDRERFARLFVGDGWTVTPHGDGLLVASGELAVHASPAPLGEILAGATLVLGQGGTANEAAASLGLPVVALETRESTREGWYRMRQARLLGEALLTVSGDDAEAAAAIGALLRDPERRARMAATGRERMGPPGGARAIAAAVMEVAGG